MRLGPSRRPSPSCGSRAPKRCRGGCGVRGCAGPGGALGGAGRPGRPCHRGRATDACCSSGARGGSDGGAESQQTWAKVGIVVRHRRGGRGGHRPGREGRSSKGSPARSAARAERGCAGGGQTARRAGHSPPPVPPSVVTPCRIRVLIDRHPSSRFLLRALDPPAALGPRTRDDPRRSWGAPGRRSRSKARPTIR